MNILRGIDVPPAIVGIARGIVEAAVMAGVVALIAWVSSKDAPVQIQVWAPIIIAGLRSVEGFADHIDPKTTRAEP